MDQSQSIRNRQVLAPYKKAITRYIRSAMALKGYKYEDLCHVLAERGIVLTPENLRSKTHKGMFSGDLLVAIIDALELEAEAIPEIVKQVRDAK